MSNHHRFASKLNNQITQNIMTNNYIKPELEILSAYSEGVLATSTTTGQSTGDDITIGETHGWN